MENAQKLAQVLDWMRRNKVASYTEHPSGGFSVSVFEVFPEIMPSADDDRDVAVELTDAETMMFDGHVPRLKKLT